MTRLEFLKALILSVFSWKIAKGLVGDHRPRKIESYMGTTITKPKSYWKHETYPTGTMVKYKGKLWYIGPINNGYNRVSVQSPDGITWTEVGCVGTKGPSGPEIT